MNCLLSSIEKGDASRRARRRRTTTRASFRERPVRECWLVGRLVGRFLSKVRRRVTMVRSKIMNIYQTSGPFVRIKSLRARPSADAPLLWFLPLKLRTYCRPIDTCTCLILILIFSHFFSLSVRDSMILLYFLAWNIIRTTGMTDFRHSHLVCYRCRWSISRLCPVPGNRCHTTKSGTRESLSRPRAHRPQPPAFGPSFNAVAAE